MHTSFQNSLLACCSLVTLLASPELLAAAPRPDSPAIAGSGCPGGSSQYYFSRDKTSLSVLTRQYVAAPGNVTCNIAIPISVPNGYRVNLKSLDMYGYVKGKAELRSSVFYAGQTGAAKVTTFSSSSGKSFHQHDNLPQSSSACGKDINLRLNSRARTLTNASSVRVGTLVLRVSYQRC